MERYSQYRDRGSGVAPFLPIQAQSSGIYLPFHLLLFSCRIPLLLSVSISYFLVLQWLPFGLLFKKAALWLIIGVPGIWWIDLQIDGVKKGSLAKQHQARLPQPGSVIASSFTSPIDALYLAAVFDPIFTASYPTTHLVQQISLFQAILRAFAKPERTPALGVKLISFERLISQNPNRVIACFPECTTTNGCGILPLSPSLLSVPSRKKVFPVSLRYTPADIITPIPGTQLTFLWNLCSKPTHCIRVRIANPIEGVSERYVLNQNDDRASSSDTLIGSEDGKDPGNANSKTLTHIGSALARLGRIQQVGLGVDNKLDFLKAWAGEKS